MAPVLRACAATFSDFFQVQEVSRMPRILSILGAQLLQKVCKHKLEHTHQVCNQNFKKTQLVNLHHFVCAILQMALLSSDFRSIGFFLRSTAILGRQVVLQVFHLKCCENTKKLKLVDGWVFRACTAPFTDFFRCRRFRGCRGSCVSSVPSSCRKFAI